MIDKERFIADSNDKEKWLIARARGITATAVAEAGGSEANYKSALKKALINKSIPDNPYMKFGRDSEQWIAEGLRSSHGIEPNTWLIGALYNPRYMATPDGISADHSRISEIKTTGEDWAKIPPAYYRQMQWQMMVTDTSECLFAWMLRGKTSRGDLYAEWLEPKTLVVPRDDEEIKRLIEVADRLLNDIMEGKANG